MLTSTTDTDYPDSAGTAGLVPPLANPTGQPKPKRPLATPKTGRARVSATITRDRSVGESGDAYPGVLFVVPNTSWRVAVCARGYCWILQQREARDHWQSRKYFATKRRLTVVLRELISERAFHAVEDKIEALP